MEHVLHPHDLQSAVWLKLERHYKGRLEELRRKNDGDLDDRATIRLRAQIAECKVFLALGENLAPD